MTYHEEDHEYGMYVERDGTPIDREHRPTLIGGRGCHRECISSVTGMPISEEEKAAGVPKPRRAPITTEGQEVGRRR